MSRHYGLCRNAIFEAGEPLEPSDLSDDEWEELVDYLFDAEPFARRSKTHDIRAALEQVRADAQSAGHGFRLRELYEYRDELHNHPEIEVFVRRVWSEAPRIHLPTVFVEIDGDTEETPQPKPGGTAANTLEVAMRDKLTLGMIFLPTFLVPWSAAALGAVGVIFTFLCCIGCCGGWWLFGDDPEVVTAPEPPSDEVETIVVLTGEVRDPWQLPTGCEGTTPTCPWINGGTGETEADVYAFPLRGDRSHFVDEADGCVVLERNTRGESVYVTLEPCTAVEGGDRAVGCPSGRTCLAWTGPTGNLERIHRGCLQSALGEPVTWTETCPIISVYPR